MIKKIIIRKKKEGYPLHKRKENHPNKTMI